MAQVLAVVPGAGLDAVLVSTELALESIAPSGRISLEHVLNVLSRLNTTPLPEPIETHFEVSTPPLADTARYDALREKLDEEIGHA